MAYSPIFPMLKASTTNTLRDSWRNFTKCSSRLTSRKFFRAASHMAKSAAMITLPASYFDDGAARDSCFTACILRPQMKKQIALKPVLSWHTRIIQLKRCPPERTSVTATPSSLREIASSRPCRSVTPTVTDDCLSNRGEVLVRGQTCAGGRQSEHGFDYGRCYRYTKCTTGR